MRTVTIDVVADSRIIGHLEHAESHFADWDEMSQKARQMAMELCPECKELQIRVAGICLLDVT